MAWSKEDEQRLFWFLAGSYVADTVGLLDPEKGEKLAQLSAQYGFEEGWRDHVRESLEVTDEFIQGVYVFCVDLKGEFAAMGFILRGLGCPHTDETLQEVMG